VEETVGVGKEVGGILVGVERVAGEMGAEEEKEVEGVVAVEEMEGKEVQGVVE
jgi:hypothetical protein